MYKQILILCLAFFCISCGDSGSGNTNDTFDRSAMLRNYADNYIVPAYEALYLRLLECDSAVNQFVQKPDPTLLAIAQEKWKNAAKAWQLISFADFGPAEDNQGTLSQNIATFPVSASKIEDYIAANDTLFQNFNRDTRGFYAIEYLLFAPHPEIISLYADDKRKAYLRSLSRVMVQRIQAVLSAWKGSYRQEFISNTGTQAGSPVSELYNSFVFSYEVLKNYKIGLPAGKRAGQTAADPRLVEAYYSRMSLEFIQLQMGAISAFYEGNFYDKSRDRLGFAEYLSALTGGTELVRDTRAQWQAIVQAFNALPAYKSFSTMIIQDMDKITLLYGEMNKHTRFFKSEMSSLMGIAITYSSGDGD